MTPSRRSELRSQAHQLDPVVIIGDKKGLSDEVLAEIDRSLKAHELIKIRAATDDRDAREQWMEKICAALQAEAIQQIGKVLVVYRENFDKPREKKKEPDPGSKPRKRGVRDDKSRVIRTERPRSRSPSPRPESGPRRRRRSTSQ